MNEQAKQISDLIEQHRNTIAIIRSAKKTIREAKRNQWLIHKTVDEINGLLCCCARGWINYEYNKVAKPDLSTRLCCVEGSKAFTELFTATVTYDLHLSRTARDGCNIVLINDDGNNRYGFGDHPKTRVLTYLWGGIKFYSEIIDRLEQQLKQLLDNEVEIHE